MLLIVQHNFLIKPLFIFVSYPHNHPHRLLTKLSLGFCNIASLFSHYAHTRVESPQKNFLGHLEGTLHP